MSGGVADVIVVGAGVGGLAAALRLAEGGARVRLLEALTYPGGCAATFERRGERHEAGATLLAGLDAGGFLPRWLARNGVTLDAVPLDPVVRVRAPSLGLDVPADRGAFVRRFLALPGAPRAALQAFFAQQGRLAEPLWGLLTEPGRLPPPRLATLGFHARQLPAYVRLARWVGRPLADLVAHHGLVGFEPLRVYLDAVCQITVQTCAARAEAPQALAVLDYWFRGAAHLRGGVGRLAEGFVEALRRRGGEALFARRAQGLARRGGAWEVATRAGPLRARHVVLNLLPRAVKRLLPPVERPLPRLERLARAVDGGWGAAMLYLTLQAPVGEDAGAQHWQVVDDEAHPFVEGNHLFVSISAADEVERAGPGLRTATVSTHVPLERLRALDPAGRAAYVGEVQARMRRTLERRLPAWSEGVRSVMPASPRTFERFTSRPEGAVGGVPRRAGWGCYRDLVPAPLLPGLWLVGDTQFPGQSTLATAVGGWRLAERILRG